MKSPAGDLPRFVFGLDLGQAQDYSALVVAQQLGDAPPYTHHVRQIRRYALGTRYPSVVDDVAGLLAGVPRGVTARLAVDETGVGRPVVDLFERAGLKPIAVNITGGTAVVRAGRRYSVPKRELVSVVQAALQTGRLKIAEALPEAATLLRELLAFRVTISATGHDSYAAWRERDHDDLVLALAMALWVAENPPRSWGLAA